MRTPEHRAHPRAGKKFEADLDMHYLAPGAFTVLPPEGGRIPDPPTAPPPYRLTPTSRRHKHQSFAIIGETTSSSPNSRSSSPSGRVSPFKGRGFNPIGSRHASPMSSPTPPEDARLTPRALSPRNGSRIPQPTSRRGTASAVFGEKVNHHEKNKGLHGALSQSLTNLGIREGRTVSRRPPQSPRKKPAFKQLSPIVGSSPEPSQSLSSPSRIPTKSRSTPPSRLTSPTRESTKVPPRSLSRGNLNKNRDPSPSTLHSPTRIPIKKYHNVKSKVNSYNKPKVPPKPVQASSENDSDSPRKNVLSRKNSMNRTSSRPNLLPKTGNYMKPANANYNSDSSLSTDQAELSKKVPANSVGSKVSTKSVGNSNSNSFSTSGKTTVIDKTSSVTKTNETVNNDNKIIASTSKPTVPKKEGATTHASTAEETEKKNSLRGSKMDLTDTDSTDMIPSTNAMVSSTTTTVTKPLKIETPQFDRKPVSPMIDGRVLSATTVSNAINKMNDTVLNTQTLIKDSGLQNRPVGAVISVGSVNKTDKGGTADAKKAGGTDVKAETSKKVDDKTVEKANGGVIVKGNEEKSEPSREMSIKIDEKTAKVSPNNSTTIPITTNSTNRLSEGLNLPKPPSTNPITNNHHNHIINNHSANHTSTIGLGNAKALEMEVQNNMNRLIGSMDSSLGDTPVNKMSANDRIREARTVIAADVKPIRITVREKPSDVEVQSGNVGPHFSMANGINERPGLPPSHQNSPPNEPAKEEPPPTACKRFLNRCTQTLTCHGCKRGKTEPRVEEANEEKSSGCFKCLTKKPKQPKREQVRINIEEDGVEKSTFWNKLQCCKKNQNKVGDTGSCFPIGKRKESWVDKRTDSFLESETQNKTKCCSKDGCKNFFKALFCISLCCKKKEEPPPPARKESMISSKKKSLTPTSMPPPEDTTPKIDASLVEHTSHMKGAIPILPICLAWFCCIMNCIGPGTGTVLSGFFCLCIGKPRFSQKDGPKPRIGAFIIDLIIGFSQFFTVLFCLVGWGWSIWWGVIMVKIAKKHKKLKHLENLEQTAARPVQLHNHNRSDPDQGRV